MSVTVDESNPFVGKSVKGVESEYQIDIVAFVRGGVVIVPADSTEILPGDILIYQTLDMED